MYSSRFSFLNAIRIGRRRPNIAAPSAKIKERRRYQNGNSDREASSRHSGALGSGETGEDYAGSTVPATVGGDLGSQGLGG